MIEYKFTFIWDYQGHWTEKLEGLEPADSLTRKNHFFTSGVPNIELALGLLQLNSEEVSS